MVMLKNPKSYKRVVKSARPLNQDSKDNKNSSGGLFGKGLIIFVCAMIISYLIVDIICGFMIGQFLPDVLTTSWFAFWAVELINLVVVKRSKIRAQYPDLIETNPEEVVNINLRPKDEFGNFNQQVNDLVPDEPTEDNVDFEPVEDYSEGTDNTATTNEGGNTQCLNLIY